MNVLVDMELAAGVCADHHLTVRGIVLKYKVINVVQGCYPTLIEITVLDSYVSVVVLLCLGILNLAEESDSCAAMSIGEATTVNKEVVYRARLIPT